jgi:hypothetical protein
MALERDAKKGKPVFASAVTRTSSEGGADEPLRRPPQKVVLIGLVVE